MVSCGANGKSQTGKGRKLVTPGKRRMADLQLWNWFSVLVAGKREKAIAGEAGEPPDEQWISTKGKSRVIVVGILPSGGTEGPIC